MLTTKELERLGLAAPAGQINTEAAELKQALEILADEKRQAEEQTARELRQVKAQIAEGISQRMQAEWPDINRRLRVGEAAEWIRRGAPGRALEVLELILAEYEAQDQRGH